MTDTPIRAKALKIGALLRAWREKQDMTVRDMAPLLGVSIATLSRIERGGQMDAPTQLKLIAVLFEMRFR